MDPISYPRAVADPDTGELVSDAEVAEISFTAFVPNQGPAGAMPAGGAAAETLEREREDGTRYPFDTRRYDAFITNSALDTIIADAEHRQHAIVEQTIGELKSGPLAHLPYGRFSANAAWLGFAVLAFNISRATATAAGLATARMATILRTITAAPARLASTGRRKILHLPARWPWRETWASLWRHATGTSPPKIATT